MSPTPSSVWPIAGRCRWPISPATWTSSTRHAEGRLLKAVQNRDVGLVMDLSDTRYVDSAGINLLFELAELLQARQLALAVVLPEGGLVERVFSLVNLAAVADVHRSVDAAVHAILARRRRWASERRARAR